MCLCMRVSEMSADDDVRMMDGRLFTGNTVTSSRAWLHTHMTRSSSSRALRTALSNSGTSNLHVCRVC